jgi:hypothetical protein
MIVRDAARATPAAGAARVWQARFVEGRDVISREEGVTEFARRRTRTTVEYTMSPQVEDAFRRLIERWPWLDDDDDDEASGPPQLLHAGSASWFMAGGTVSRQVDGSPSAHRRNHADPTWILEVLEHAHREARRPGDRYAFVTDLAETGTALEPPPGARSRPTRIAGEVLLDPDGRLWRATWRRHDRSRRRSPPGPPMWTTTELWDFGVPVEIDLPPPRRRPPLPVQVADVAWRLWRRKRAYERGR